MIQTIIAGPKPQTKKTQALRVGQTVRIDNLEITLTKAHIDFITGDQPTTPAPKPTSDAGFMVISKKAARRLARDEAKSNAVVKQALAAERIATPKKTKAKKAGPVLHIEEKWSSSNRALCGMPLEFIGNGDETNMVKKALATCPKCIEKSDARVSPKP